MKQMEKDVDVLYERCGIPKDLEYPVTNTLNEGELNNELYSDRGALIRNSAFSYSACGASSVGYDWLNANGYKTCM